MVELRLAFMVLALGVGQELMGQVDVDRCLKLALRPGGEDVAERRLRDLSPASQLLAVRRLMHIGARSKRARVVQVAMRASGGSPASAKECLLAYARLQAEVGIDEPTLYANCSSLPGLLRTAGALLTEEEIDLLYAACLSILSDGGEEEAVIALRMQCALDYLRVGRGLSDRERFADAIADLFIDGDPIEVRSAALFLLEADGLGDLKVRLSKDMESRYDAYAGMMLRACRDGQPISRSLGGSGEALSWADLLWPGGRLAWLVRLQEVMVAPAKGRAGLAKKLVGDVVPGIPVEEWRVIMEVLLGEHMGVRNEVLQAIKEAGSGMSAKQVEATRVVAKGLGEGVLRDVDRALGVGRR